MADTEIQRSLIIYTVGSIVVIQRYLFLTPLPKIPGCAKPRSNRLVIYQNIRMNQLISQMRNVKYGEQPVRDNLIDRFMPGDAMEGIIIGELIENLRAIWHSFLSFQKRTGCAG